MGKTSRLVATTCSVAVLALAQAAFAAGTSPQSKASGAKPEAGVDTGTGCDQLTGRDRETCLQALPGGRARGDTTMRDRSSATGSSAPARDRSNANAGAGSTRSGEVVGPNANSGLDTGSGCDRLTGQSRQDCLNNLPSSRRQQR